jgi:hypothetical protein
MMEELRFSETSALTRSTRRNIPEDAILHSHRRENLGSYIPLGVSEQVSVQDIAAHRLGTTDMFEVMTSPKRKRRDADQV